MASSDQTDSRSRQKSEKALLHVNLPLPLVEAIRALAREERRPITSQVALLLEESEPVRRYMQSK